MKSDLAVILREILGGAISGWPAAAEIRTRLKEKGVSTTLIEDAIFLYEVLGEMSPGRKDSSVRPTRVLSSEELRGLNPGVVGKLFRLYYLGYFKNEELESVMTDILFVPPDAQNDRARESVARLLGVTSAQAEFIFDGGLGDAVVH